MKDLPCQLKSTSVDLFLSIECVHCGCMWYGCHAVQFLLVKCHGTGRLSKILLVTDTTRNRGL
jgi:hypothetical protein